MAARVLAVSLLSLQSYESAVSAWLYLRSRAWRLRWTG